MELDQFGKRIIDTILYQCNGVFIWLAILLMVLVTQIVYYCVTKDNKGLSLWTFIPVFKSKFSAKEHICLETISVLATLVLIGFTIVPAVKDVSKQQYECVFGQCTYTADGKRNKLLASKGRMRVETEENVFYLELPVDWDADDFPADNTRGEIWYSKESKIILSFDAQTD